MAWRAAACARARTAPCGAAQQAGRVVSAITGPAAASGCQRSEFWLRARQVLGPNIAACGADGAAAVHTGRAEDFLRRARAAPGFADAAFDYIRRAA